MKPEKKEKLWKVGERREICLLDDLSYEMHMKIRKLQILFRYCVS
jgi:hypothetical protein